MGSTRSIVLLKQKIRESFKSYVKCCWIS